MTKFSAMTSQKKSHLIIYLFVVVCVLYFLHLMFYYVSFDTDRMFGYLDYQIHWQSQYDLVSGKILYRDFFWEYGFLTLFLRLPFFFLLGKTFYSSFFNNFVFLPLLAIALSYGIARQYLSKKSALLFFFLMLLYKLNTDFNTVRHLIPEFGLITAMLGILQQDTRKKLIGSFILGISLLSSVEYALVSNISFVIFFILHIIFSEKKAVIKNFIQTFSFQIVIGMFFLIYLLSNKILDTYINFHLQFVQAFYTSSPDRSVFPRFSTISEVFQNKEGWFFNFFTLLQKWNVYVFVPIVIFLLVWNIRHKKSRWFLLNFTLIMYSVFAYTRTLSTPGYFHYGLTFILLMISSLLFSSKTTKRTKILSLIFICWLIIASGYHHTFKDISNYFQKEKTEQEYLPVAGMNLTKELAHAYTSVTDYIVRNTSIYDYIYVYPDGPYYALTNRKSAVPVSTPGYYGLAPVLVDHVYSELSAKKPKYIIINKHNSFNYVSSINGVQYNVYSSGKDIIIEGLTTKIEDYIQQNYEVESKQKIAWILKRKDKQIPLKKLYVPSPDQNNWQIQVNNLEQSLSIGNPIFFVKNTNSEIYYIRNDLNSINMIKIPIRVDVGLIKQFSKFTFDVYVIANNQPYPIKRGFISSDWQNIYIYIPPVNDPSVTIQAVALRFPPNSGFMFWEKPSTVELRPPTAYTLNTNSDIDDSIFK